MNLDRAQLCSRGISCDVLTEALFPRCLTQRADNRGLVVSGQFTQGSWTRCLSFSPLGPVDGVPWASSQHGGWIARGFREIGSGTPENRQRHTCAVFHCPSRHRARPDAHINPTPFSGVPKNLGLSFTYPTLCSIRLLPSFPCFPAFSHTVPLVSNTFLHFVLFPALSPP